MKFGDYPKASSLDGVAGFRDYMKRLGLDMPCDDIVMSGPASPLGAPLEFDGMSIGNRIGTQPMEGWDCETDGRPTENTKRRWQRFGQSGAKLIWGGEACAVRSDGRANPKQLYMADHTQSDIAELREGLIKTHKEATGDDRGLVIGLQLTHSGRYCKPHDNTRFESIIAYNHPILDRRVGYPADRPVISDDEIKRLIADYIIAAKRAQQCGFDFVDIKHCHGYLGHEFLSAVTRPGPYGGSLENRTRFLREIVEGIRAEAPGLRIGVRLSAIDTVPYRPDPANSKPGELGPGIPEEYSVPYVHAFGANPANPLEYDLTEPKALLEILRSSASGSSMSPGQPVLQSALHPAGALSAVRRLSSAGGSVRRRDAPPRRGARPQAGFPGFLFHGQRLHLSAGVLPNVAQAVVRQGWVDVVGLGRMVLAYPELPLDILSGRGVQKKRLCRTFSDCTTAPRNGIVSGCYPLDALYKKSPEFKQLAGVKKPAKTA